jgi:hypothetical protein
MENNRPLWDGLSLLHTSTPFVNTDELVFYDTFQRIQGLMQQFTLTTHHLHAKVSGLGACSEIRREDTDFIHCLRRFLASNFKRRINIMHQRK